MVLAKSREKGMSIRFFHMLHFILPCLVMSNICYMHTLDKVSTSSNFSSVLQGYDRTCYVIPWGRMDVPWPHHCAPEGDRFNSALQHLQRPPMVRALLLLSYALFFWLCGLPTRHSWDCVLNQAVFLTSVVRLCSCSYLFLSYENRHIIIHYSSRVAPGTITITW